MKTFNHDPVSLNFELLQHTTPEVRWYTVKGESRRYPSVTTITGWSKRKIITAWRNNIGEAKANDILDFAGNRGRLVHESIEAYLKNQLKTSSIQYMHILPYYKHLARIDNIKLQESRLYSEELGLAGTVDCVADFDGVPSIIDFKTSRKTKKEEHIEHYFAQCSAYAIMLKERLGIDVGQLVVMINADDGFCVSHVRKVADYVPQLKEMISEWFAHNNIDQYADPLSI